MISSLIAFFARAICGASAHWVGCVPESNQRIYFSNHTSNLDALVLWAVLPQVIRNLTQPVAARDYWSKGRVRPYLAEKVFSAILIERYKPTAQDNPIDQILAAMGTTNSIIIFPEGGRCLESEPRRFKSGIYHLAKKRPDIELIPIYIDNISRILPKGEVLPVPMLGSVTFGSPLGLHDDETKEQFLERARKEVLDLRDGVRT